MYSLLSEAECECQGGAGKWAPAEEEVLLDSRYRGFMESALVLSDAHERGEVQDLAAFQGWCLAISREIAGKDLGQVEDVVRNPEIPAVIRRALNAILTGLLSQSSMRAETAAQRP